MTSLVPDLRRGCNSCGRALLLDDCYCQKIGVFGLFATVLSMPACIVSWVCGLLANPTEAYYNRDHNTTACSDLVFGAPLFLLLRAIAGWHRLCSQCTVDAATGEQACGEPTCCGGVLRGRRWFAFAAALDAVAAAFTLGGCGGGMSPPSDDDNDDAAGAEDDYADDYSSRNEAPPYDLYARLIVGFVLAVLVCDAIELAWRLLARRYDAAHPPPAPREEDEEMPSIAASEAGGGGGAARAATVTATKGGGRGASAAALDPRVRAFLDGLGLGRHAAAFARQEIEFAMLPRLTDAALRDELGVDALGARIKILDAAAAAAGDGDVPVALPIEQASAAPPQVPGMPSAAVVGVYGGNEGGREGALSAT